MSDDKSRSNPSQPVLTRRRLLTAGAVVPIATAAAAKVIQGDMPWEEGGAAPPLDVVRQIPSGYIFFQPAESAFVEAAVARLIPKDELGPGALEAGAAVFIDRQLAGEYGKGLQWYLQGPWGDAEPTQGYQTRFSPAGLYRAAIKDIDDAVGKEGRAHTFAKLSTDDQDRWLHDLEKGKVQLANVDPKTFFQLLHQNTLEGFWADPLYGGNKDMVGWKLIGFPGARYDYREHVGKHGQPFPLPPVSIMGRAEWKKES